MKKILLSILIAVASLFFLTPNLRTVSAADSTWYSQGPIEWYLKVYDEDTSPANEIFGERYTAAQVRWVVYSIPTMFLNFIDNFSSANAKPITCLSKIIAAGTFDLDSCLGDFEEMFTLVIDKIFPKAIYDTKANTSLFAKVFDTTDRKISGINYTKDLVSRINPISEIKAQSYGYYGLTWLQKYWQGCRDIAYTFIVLVTIIFAFMIMFRVKINPQTIITIQSAIPKILVVLLLITFSYAIAGFAIDLMYVFSGLAAILLKTAGFASNTEHVFNLVSGSGGVVAMFQGSFILLNMIAYAVAFIITALIFTVISMLSSWLTVDPFTAGPLIGVIFIVIGLWCVILAFWYMFKVTFVLFKTLISIYLSIITAPLQILAGTIVPSAGFGPWFKRLIADILVFPMTGLLIWLSWHTLWSAWATSSPFSGFKWPGYLFAIFDIAPITTKFWAPGLIGSVQDIGGVIFLAISFGIIVLLPKVPDLLKSVLLGEKFSFGTAMGEAVGIANKAWSMSPAKNIWETAKANKQSAMVDNFMTWATLKLKGIFGEGTGERYAKDIGIEEQDKTKLKDINESLKGLKGSLENRS